MREPTGNESIMLRNKDQMFEKVTHLFNKAESEILVYATAETMKITTRNETLRSLKVDARRRGVKLRYLTEITSDNIEYCKEQSRMVNELRHLDGIKGNFILSESEFMVSPEISERLPMTSGSHGSQGHMLKLYWGIFETTWTHAVPGIKRIGELETIPKTGPFKKSFGAEKIKILVCVQCEMLFGFQEDIQYHQKTTGHTGITEAPFG
jgi:hypothetical protein